MEPHPGDQWLLAQQIEQLTLFDVDDFLSDDNWDEDGWEHHGEDCDCVDPEKSWVHLNGSAGEQVVPLPEYLTGFSNYLIDIFTMEMVLLPPLDQTLDAIFLGGKFHIGTPTQIAALIETAEIMDSLEDDE